MKNNIILLAFIICGIMGTISAQTFVTMGGSTTSVTGCDFIILDHGGLQGNYGPHRNDILTIHSDDPMNPNVQVKINMGYLEICHNDTLFVYDGDMVADSLLLAAINSQIANNVSANELVYTATVHNPSGAITLRFKSDDTLQSGGYLVETSCVRACQRVGLDINPFLSSHYPQLDTDGFYYIDLCGNDTLHLVVNGVYPDNDYTYHQADTNVTFKWDLGVDYMEGEGMTVLDYLFEAGRGYDISISNEDSAGCKNMMPTIFRIRTSMNPIKHIQPLPAICSGDEITITSGYSNLSILQIDSVHSVQETSLAVNDTVFIPDGVDCGNGCEYYSPVTFTAFAPNATIQSADDILYVRIKMEHSYIGDVYIALTCPNGQRAKIMNKYGSSGSSQCSAYIPVPWGWQMNSGVTSSAFFGIAFDNSNGCDPNDHLNQMGQPWNYCWSNNTSNGYQYANGFGYVYETVNVHNGSVDSTNTLNMTNVYHPDEPFSSLIGCPMNGQWAITVIDGWGADNGWITEWEMALDPSLVPQDWSYTVFADSVYVTGPGAENSTIIPSEGGDFEYTVHVIDDLGCEYDSSFVLNVVEKPHPDLGPDIAICHGDLYELDCGYDEPYTSLVWSTGEHTPSIFLTSAGDYSVRVSVTNEDGLVCVGSDTVNVYVSPKPTPEFTASDTSGCAPLTVHFNNASFANDTMGMSYHWIIYDENGNVVLTSDKATPDLQFDHEGQYTVKLVVITDEGCTDSITKYNYLTINYQPLAEFDALPEVSLWSETNGSIFFQVQGDTLEFGDGMGFYWDFGDGSIDSSSYSLEHNFPSWGDYDVTLSMFTPEGCNSSITHTVTLEADLIFPNVITPNGDGVNDVFAIGNLNTSVNDYDPDKYRNNELTIYDRWGKQIYHALNYDTFMDMTGKRGNGIIVGEQVFDASKVTDGTYYFTFLYKGKLKTVNYHGTLHIINEK